MFASEHRPPNGPSISSINPHRTAPRAARACHDSAAFCSGVSTTPRALLRSRRPGIAERAPQRCLVAEARQG